MSTARRIWLIGIAVFVVAAVVTWNKPVASNPYVHWGWYALYGLGFWLITVPLCWWVFRTSRLLTRAAIKHVPSPQEIHDQLVAEGYQPTLEEVFAVEQYLRSERNEAVVALGAVLVGLHLAAGQAH